MVTRLFKPNESYPEMTFSDAGYFLGKKESRKVQNHTYLHRCDNETIAVRFWHTDVVTYKKDGRVILNTGGWDTVSTRERMDTYDPWGWVIQDRGRWWYHQRGYWRTKNGKPDYCNGSIYYEFQDGMRIGPKGVPNTRRREVVVLEEEVLLDSITFKKTGKSLNEAQAKKFVGGLELKQVKRLMRKRELRYFVLDNCKRELVPAFLGYADNDKDLMEIIEGRLKGEQDSK